MKSISEGGSTALRGYLVTVSWFISHHSANSRNGLIRWPIGNAEVVPVGRPPGFDSRAYKGRNVVERVFSKAKHWRGVATRYDKLACQYRAGIVMALTVEWLKLSGDMA